MLDYKTRPVFGGRQNIDAYYEAVNSVIHVLRPVATMRVIAAHLNSASFKTPSGKSWTRDRVKTYLRGTAVQTN